MVSFQFAISLLSLVGTFFLIQPLCFWFTGPKRATSSNSSKTLSSTASLTTQKTKPITCLISLISSQFTQSASAPLSLWLVSLRESSTRQSSPTRNSYPTSTRLSPAQLNTFSSSWAFMCISCNKRAVFVCLCSWTQKRPCSPHATLVLDRQVSVSHIICIDSIGQRQVCFLHDWNNYDSGSVFYHDWQHFWLLSTFMVLIHISLFIFVHTQHLNLPFDCDKRFLKQIFHFQKVFLWGND
jgi:hypothetical protein